MPSEHTAMLIGKSNVAQSHKNIIHKWQQRISVYTNVQMNWLIELWIQIKIKCQETYRKTNQLM